jgi:hypothetical protein
MLRWILALALAGLAGDVCAQTEAPPAEAPIAADAAQAPAAEAAVEREGGAEGAQAAGSATATDAAAATEAATATEPATATDPATPTPTAISIPNPAPTATATTTSGSTSTSTATALDWSALESDEVASLLGPPMPPGRVSLEAAVDADPRLRQPPRRQTRLGLQLDAGFPDGAGLSLLYRPWFWLRLGAGGSYNLASSGVRGSVTLAPSPYLFTPTLTLEAGRMFRGDARGRFRQFGGGELDPAADVLLSAVSYDYHTVALGFELGWQRRVVYFVHFGITYLSAELNDFARAIQAQNPDLRVEAQDPTVSFSAPHVKTGFNFYFW